MPSKIELNASPGDLSTTSQARQASIFVLASFSNWWLCIVRSVFGKDNRLDTSISSQIDPWKALAVVFDTRTFLLF